MTEEQEEDIEKQLNTDDEDLVNVDGTKVKLSGKLLKVKTGILLCLHTLTGIGLYLEKTSRHGTSFLMRSLDFTSLSHLWFELFSCFFVFCSIAHNLLNASR